MRSVGPPGLSSGQECIKVDVFPENGRVARQLGALFNQVVVTVVDVIVKQLSVLHGGHTLACESGLAIDPNEISGLCRKGTLDHLLH